MATPALGEAARLSAAGRARIVLSRVAKGFGLDETREEVIADLDFEITPGELTALVGPSGCGKTTIANLVAGYEKPDRGQILLDGAPVRGAGRDRMLVFQESALSRGSRPIAMSPSGWSSPARAPPQSGRR